MSESQDDLSLAVDPLMSGGTDRGGGGSKAPAPITVTQRLKINRPPSPVPSFLVVGRAPNKRPAQGMPSSTINVTTPDRGRVRWTRVESF